MHSRPSEIELARALPEHRNPHEPWYSDPARVGSVFDRTQVVPDPDGGFHLKSFEAHGGLMASTPALTTFLDRYWLSGHPRDLRVSQWWAFGSMPGTFTFVLQRTTVDLVVLFNQRTVSSGLDYLVIREVLENAVEATRTW